MIADAEKLRELVEELAELPLEARRAHIADVEQKQGKSAADQLRAGLRELWRERDK